jgi:hypothetical protein
MKRYYFIISEIGPLKEEAVMVPGVAGRQDMWLVVVIRG